MDETMKTIEISKTYKEVYVILSKLDLLKLLPVKVVQLLKNNMNQDYNFDISTSIPLEEQKIGLDTKTFLSYLYLKYINKNTNERKYLEQKYYKNEEKRINKLKSVANIEPKKEIMLQGETTIAIVKKENLLQKIINKIRKIFKKEEI